MNFTHPTIHRHPGRKSGFTMVEVMISLTVLTVAVYLMSSTITATMGHSAKRKERTLALEAAMNTLETMRALPFRELCLLYNSDPLDDPDGPNTAPGNTFEVNGLTPGQNATAAGVILMPTFNGKVREDVIMPALGMPRDLSGDFVVDALDKTKNHVILPISVRINWVGSAGESELEVTSMFSAVQKDLQ